MQDPVKPGPSKGIFSDPVPEDNSCWPALEHAWGSTYEDLPEIASLFSDTDELDGLPMADAPG